MHLKFVEVLLVGFAVIELSLEHCYELKMLNFRISETPDYRFEMTMHNNQTLSSITRVLKPVTVPMWHIVLVQYSSVRNALGKLQPPRTLYNATYKVCEFWRYVKRIRVFDKIAHLLLSKEGGNMSLACPLAVGTYVLRNMHVPPDTAIMKFMYWPNTLYTLFGTVYAQQPNKSLETKATYAVNGTVIKSC